MRPVLDDLRDWIIRGVSGSARMTPSQHAILEKLSEKPKVCSHDSLVEAVWSWNSGEIMDPVGNISVHVFRLRKNMRKVNAPYDIQNIRGAGYRLVEKTFPGCKISDFSVMTRRA